MNHNDILKYVLNENNKLINKTFIENILNRYGLKYKVKNLETFQTALTHPSYVKRDLTNDRIVKLITDKNLQPINENDIANALPLQNASYERLEFLGDSVIHLCLAEYLFDRYKDEYEGFMTRLRTKIENSETLSELAKIIGLCEYTLIARNFEQNGGRDKNGNIFEDAFEAFIGALFLESDYDTCNNFLVNLIQKEVDISQLLYVETNYKDTLLQYYHKMKWPDPEYGLEEIFETNKDNQIKKYFKMWVKGYGQNNDCTQWMKVGIGLGTSKKKGEQLAAKQALLNFNAIKDDSDCEEEIYEEAEEIIEGSDSEIEIIEIEEPKKKKTDKTNNIVKDNVEKKKTKKNIEDSDEEIVEKPKKKSQSKKTK